MMCNRAGSWLQMDELTLFRRRENIESDGSYDKGGGQVLCSDLTLSLLTNAWVVCRFVTAVIDIAGTPGRPGLITIHETGLQN
jgi:RNA 3'-terminal phosphate cyclase